MLGDRFKRWKNEILLAGREKRLLVSGQFELTGLCNLDCKMCYVHTLNTCIAKQKELSTAQWKSLFDEAYNIGMFFFTLTGGECLLRKDFKELYLYLYSKNVFVKVFTNATLITDDYVSFFQQYKPEYIQVSLYGVSEEGYLRVTGHKGFEKTVAAIRALKAAGIDVRVAVTPSVYIKEEYIEIIKFCKENGFTCKPAEMVLISNREDASKNDYLLSMDEMVDLSAQQTALNKILQPVESTPEPMGHESCPKIGLECNAGNCLCTVTWDGKMYPCPTTILGEGFDVRELGFAEAWKRTQEAAANIMLPVECVGCAYEKICIKCPALRSPKLDGHCDPQICELTRRLVAAGVKKLP